MEDLRIFSLPESLSRCVFCSSFMFALFCVPFQAEDACVYISNVFFPIIPLIIS